MTVNCSVGQKAWSDSRRFYFKRPRVCAKENTSRACDDSKPSIATSCQRQRNSLGNVDHKGDAGPQLKAKVDTPILKYIVEILNFTDI